MDWNWAERLDAHRGELSRREVALVDFVTAQPHRAAFLKQTDLALEADVSKPVVISCFRTLGYPDYQAFLEGIQGFYAGQIDSARASTLALRDVTDVAALVNLALDVEASTLETLRRHLDPAQVESLARTVLGAPVVWLYAEGTGFLPAHYLSQRLRRCGLRAVLVGGDRAHLVDDLGPVGAGDLLLTFFYTQDRTTVADLLDLCQARGAVTALVTGTPDPGLYARADHHLFVPRGQWSFKNSLAAPMAFAQILLLAVEFLGGAEVQDRLNVLESTRKGFGSRKKEEES